MADSDIIKLYDNLENKDITKPKDLIVIDNKKIHLSFALGSENNYGGILAEDGKLFKKYSFKAMNMFRTSPEYKEMLIFLLNTYPKLERCIVYKDFEDVELHHHPMTLYDMTTLIMLRRIKLGMPFNTFMISQELIDYHEREMVGLIPLSKTMHKLVHANVIKPSVDFIHGDWLGFLKEFKDYYSKDIFYSFMKKIEWNRNIYEIEIDKLKRSRDNLKYTYMNETLTADKLKPIPIKKIKTISYNNKKEE